MKSDRRLFQVVRAGVARALGTAVWLMLASAANAQTVIDATTAEFQPSVDHSATDPGGAPLVTNYVLRFFPGESSTPSHSIDLGKPAPDGEGLIRFPFRSHLTTPLVPGTIYQAQVSAVGPGGTAASELSNTFTVTNGCAPALSSSSATVGAGAGTGSVSVADGADCPWTASSDAAWLTVPPGASGTGPGSIEFSVAANEATAPRTGTLTVAGLPFTVTQEGVPCTYTVTPDAILAPSAGVAGSVAIDTLAGCAWTFSSDASWLTATSEPGEGGPGSVSYVVDANSEMTSRTGTLTVAGLTFTVTQMGVPCTAAVTPTSLASPSDGETMAVDVVTPPSCEWTSTSHAAWIALEAAGGSGDGSVAVTVAANPTALQRVGSVTIAGHTLTVTQQRAPCSYVVTPATIAVAATGVSGSLSIATLTGCGWSAAGVPGWITIGTVIRSGPGSLAYTVAPNAGPARSVTLSVGGKPVTLNQSASPTPPPPANVRIVGGGSPP